MRVIPHDSITIAPDRQRREFPIDEHQELVDSIRSKGLLHAPVLRRDGDALVLVAGERRLRAISDLASLDESFRFDGEQVLPGMVPYVLVSDLSELEAEEAELEENIRRVDLSWQERAAVTARLADLRSKQARASGATPPTTAAISLEVRGRADGSYQEATRQELLLAKHLDRPEVAKAKSAAEAFKILKRVEQNERNAELGRSVGKVLSGASHRIVQGEAVALMREMPSDSIDVLLSDPPYGMGADTFGDSGGMAAGAHFYLDDYTSWRELMANFVPESYRVSKPEAALYLFCDIDRFRELRDLVEAAGWNAFRTPLIWFKPNGSRAPWPDAGPQRKYEVILYAIKGAKKVQHLRGDVLEYSADENLGHPAQKPVGLYEDLLRRSASPGDRVLDPFAGTGPIIPAAHALKLYATAFERDEAAYGILAGRVKGLV
jgi:site-specific DNA-methyltransferase (adenine-specific)